MLFVISQIVGSPADGRTVSLHDTPLLPSRPSGLGLESRRSTRRSVARNTSWRPRRRALSYLAGDCSAILFDSALSS
jgi:hypothetical protein